MGDWDAMQHRLLAHDDEEEVHRDMDRASDQVKGPALSEPARYISGASLGVFGDPDADLDHREIHGGEPLDDSNRHGGFGPDHDANYDQHYDDERGYEDDVRRDLDRGRDRHDDGGREPRWEGWRDGLRVPRDKVLFMAERGCWPFAAWTTAPRTLSSARRRRSATSRRCSRTAA